MLNNPTRVVRDTSRWMLQVLEESGRKGFTVGCSGGIDSAVAYRLAQQTGRPVHAIFLPKNLQQDAALRPLVNELTGDLIDQTVIIEDLINLDILPRIDENADKDRMALGNLAARSRMAMLYYFAEYYGDLVVGTTNAAEWYIGYYTKYGDGGVDLEPICGLLKHEVYQLGREGFTNPVPQSILHAVPSANLWVNQTDEGEMGFSYDELDAWISQGIDSLVPVPIIDRIVAMHHATDHKRSQPGHCCVSGQDCPVCTHLYGEENGLRRVSVDELSHDQ